MEQRSAPGPSLSRSWLAAPSLSLRPSPPLPLPPSASAHIVFRVNSAPWCCASQRCSSASPRGVADSLQGPVGDSSLLALLLQDSCSTQRHSCTNTPHHPALPLLHCYSDLPLWDDALHPPHPKGGGSPPGLPILLQPCLILPPASVPSSDSVSPLLGKQQVQETGQLLEGRISNPQTPLAVPSPPAHPDGGQQKLGGRAKGTKEDQMPPVRTPTQARQTKTVAGVGTRS